MSDKTKTLWNGTAIPEGWQPPTVGSEFQHDIEDRQRREEWMRQRQQNEDRTRERTPRTIWLDTSTCYDFEAKQSHTGQMEFVRADFHHAEVRRLNDKIRELEEAMPKYGWAGPDGPQRIWCPCGATYSDVSVEDAQAIIEAERKRAQK